MARGRKGRKRSGGKGAWRRKFGAASRACFKEGPTSPKMFGKCMKRKLR